MQLQQGLKPMAFMICHATKAAAHQMMVKCLSLKTLAAAMVAQSVKRP